MRGSSPVPAPSQRSNAENHVTFGSDSVAVEGRARRTASEKKAGKMDGDVAPSPQAPHVFSLAFPSSRLSPQNEVREKALLEIRVPKGIRAPA